MKIIDYLKNKINRRKNKNQLLLDTHENRYKDLINDEQISNILDNIPKNLSKIEKAYYIYIELGRILKETPEYRFTKLQDKKELYNREIDNRYYGICMTISELYINVLKKVGISADLSKRHPDNELGHIDAILNINGKHYITNLIADLSRIKTSKRINHFCFDLSRDTGDIEENEDNQEYLDRLETYYAKINSLSREEVEQLDKKLGYSFFIPRISDSKRGIYAEDTINLLRKEMNNTEKFKKYILHNKDVPENEWLKYKLDFILGNIDKIIDFNGNMGPMENINFYMKLFQKLLSNKEIGRINIYLASIDNEPSKLVSILEVTPPLDKLDDKDYDSVYYLYSNFYKKFIERSPQEISKLSERSIQLRSTFFLDCPGQEQDEHEL